MTSSEQPTPDKAPVVLRKPIGSPRGFSGGAFWGAMIGVNGWVFGLLCYALAVGELGSVWRVVIGGLILSTGVGVLLLLPSARPGGADYVGRLLITLSLVGTLYMHWASPQLQDVPSLSFANRWHAVPDFVILSLGFAGLVVVAMARSRHRAVRVLRRRLAWGEDVI